MLALALEQSSSRGFGVPHVLVVAGEALVLYVLVATAALMVLGSLSIGRAKRRRARSAAGRRHGAARALLQRIHNPRSRTCGCAADCWCRTSAVGRAVKWWFPAERFGVRHKGVPAGWERQRDPGTS